MKRKILLTILCFGFIYNNVKAMTLKEGITYVGKAALVTGAIYAWVDLCISFQTNNNK